LIFWPTATWQWPISIELSPVKTLADCKNQRSNFK
jgi:hypothetical protein